MLAHRKISRPNPGPLFTVCAQLALALANNQRPARPAYRNKIVHPPAIDIGFAVEAEDGVLVPVIRAPTKCL